MVQQLCEFQLKPQKQKPPETLKKLCKQSDAVEAEDRKNDRQV